MGLGFTTVLAQTDLFGGLFECETAIKPLPDGYDTKQMLDSVACILRPTTRRRQESVGDVVSDRSLGDTEPWSVPQNGISRPYQLLESERSKGSIIIERWHGLSLLDR